MTVVKEDAERIQTSFLNANEKKVLVWLAERQPNWMTSDILTWIGTFGAAVVAVGYILVPMRRRRQLCDLVLLRMEGQDPRQAGRLGRTLLQAVSEI